MYRKQEMVLVLGFFFVFNVFGLAQTKSPSLEDTFNFIIYKMEVNREGFKVISKNVEDLSVEIEETVQGKNKLNYTSISLISFSFKDLINVERSKIPNYGYGNQINGYYTFIRMIFKDDSVMHQFVKAKDINYISGEVYSYKDANSKTSQGNFLTFSFEDDETIEANRLEKALNHLLSYTLEVDPNLFDD